MDEDDMIIIYDTDEDADLEEKAPVPGTQEELARREHSPKTPAPPPTPPTATSTAVSTVISLVASSAASSSSPSAESTEESMETDNEVSKATLPRRHCDEGRAKQSRPPEAMKTDNAAVLTPAKKARAEEQSPASPRARVTLFDVDGQPPVSPRVHAARFDAQSIPRVLPRNNPQFTRAEWPHHVVHLKTNFNPDGIVLPTVPTFGSCGCVTRCRRHTCQNARLGIFCSSNCCPFSGECGNGLVESKNLTLARLGVTSSLTVLASKPIPKGVVVGQYLGRMTLTPARSARIQNRGYRLMMHAAPKGCGSWRACIDADMFGSMMRFVNHSCRPNTQFHEVANGTMHSIIVATTREIRAGEQITTDYGNDLWFICRCGEKNCRHHDIQHRKQ